MALTPLVAASVSVLLAASAGSAPESSSAGGTTMCQIWDTLASFGLDIETCAQKAEREQEEAESAEHHAQAPAPSAGCAQRGEGGDFALPAAPEGTQGFGDQVAWSRNAGGTTILFVSARVKNPEPYSQTSDLLFAYRVDPVTLTPAREPFWRGAGGLGEGFGRVVLIDQDGDGRHDHFVSPDWSTEQKRHIARYFSIDPDTQEITEIPGGLALPDTPGKKSGWVAAAWDYDNAPGDEIVVLEKHDADPNNNPADLAVFSFTPQGALGGEPLFVHRGTVVGFPRATPSDVDCDGSKELVVEPGHGVPNQILKSSDVVAGKG